LKHDLENQRKSYEDKLKTLEDNYTKVKEDLNVFLVQYFSTLRTSTTGSKRIMKIF